MVLTAASLSPVLAILFGILIFVFPRILNLRLKGFDSRASRIQRRAKNVLLVVRDDEGNVACPSCSGLFSSSLSRARSR